MEGGNTASWAISYLSNPGALIRALPIALGLAALAWLTYVQFLSPVAKIPGPFWAKISRLWLAYHGWVGDFHTTLLRLHHQYGDLVRVGPNELSVCSGEGVRKIYGIGAKFSKSEFYTPVQGKRKFDLFGEKNEEIHRQQRRIVSNIYTVAAVKELESHIDSTVAHFVEQLKLRYNHTIDFGVWLQLFAFDVIGEVTFSQRFGLLDIGEETDALVAIKESMKSTSWLCQIPLVYHIHETLKPIIGDRIAANARNSTLRDFTVNHVRAREGRETKHRDFVSRLFEIHKSKENDFDVNDVISMASSNVVAGSDTTAISMRAMFHFLLTHPECKAKLLEEIDAYYDSDEAQKHKIIPFDVANNLPYLQAVKYESMRLHPVVGQTLPRVVPAGGLQCGNEYIPAGTVVGVSPYVVGQSTEIWGDDATEFKPERWMGKNRGELQKFWMPFGGGSWTCIGKNLSWVEMSKVSTDFFLH
ncbi:hypothetical protein PV08_03681 [Exophiala spinifera]|uniref:Uncharacterized protein n=1 Tax=Exophiala spinifera TaxID=91928 RepID=A0A0D1YVT0_9EURO|nr:uncharacterized protein PV08_03681 [Exophiala spinifera]KIW19386.1 hypothetical protein PV08_03681 [Exophiala spinifera]